MSTSSLSSFPFSSKESAQVVNPQRDVSIGMRQLYKGRLDEYQYSFKKAVGSNNPALQITVANCYLSSVWDKDQDKPVNAKPEAYKTYKYAMFAGMGAFIFLHQSCFPNQMPLCELQKLAVKVYEAAAKAHFAPAQMALLGPGKALIEPDEELTKKLKPIAETGYPEAMFYYGKGLFINSLAEENEAGVLKGLIYMYKSSLFRITCPDPRVDYSNFSKKATPFDRFVEYYEEYTEQFSTVYRFKGIALSSQSDTILAMKQEDLEAMIPSHEKQPVHVVSSAILDKENKPSLNKISATAIPLKSAVEQEKMLPKQQQTEGSDEDDDGYFSLDDAEFHLDNMNELRNALSASLGSNSQKALISTEDGNDVFRPEGTPSSSIVSLNTSQAVSSMPVKQPYQRVLNYSPGCLDTSGMQMSSPIRISSPTINIDLSSEEGSPNQSLILDNQSDDDDTSALGIPVALMPKVTVRTNGKSLEQQINQFHFHINLTVSTGKKSFAEG